MDGLQDVDCAHTASSGLGRDNSQQLPDSPACKYCYDLDQIENRGKECEVCGAALKPSLDDVFEASADPVNANILAQCTTLKRFVSSESNEGFEASYHVGAEEEDADHCTNTDDSFSSSASDDSSHDGSFDDSDYDESADPTPITEHATKCRSLERMILGLPGGEQWLGDRSGHRKRCGTSRGSTTAPGSSLTSLEDPGSDWASDRRDDDDTSSNSTSDKHGSDNDSMSSMSDRRDDGCGDSSDSEDDGCEEYGEGRISFEQQQLSWRAELIPVTTSSEHASECRSLEQIISNLTDDGTNNDADKESEGSDSEEFSDDVDVDGVENRENDLPKSSKHDGVLTSMSDLKLSHEVYKEDGELLETSSQVDNEAVAIEGSEEVKPVHLNGVLSQLADHLLSLVFGFVVEINDGTEAGRGDWRVHKLLDDRDDLSEPRIKFDGKSEATQFSWASYNTAAMMQHAALIAPLRVVSKGFRDALAQGCALRLSITQGKLLVAADDFQEMDSLAECHRYPGFLQPGLAALKVVPPETHPKQWTRDDAVHEQVKEKRHEID